MLSSSGLSGSLGSAAAAAAGGSQYSSAFPVSSFTHPTHQAYSSKRDAATSGTTASTLKQQHRNSSVGLYKPSQSTGQEQPQRAAGERPAQKAGSQATSQQTNQSGKYQPQQHKQPVVNQLAQNNFGQQMSNKMVGGQLNQSQMMMNQSQLNQMNQMAHLSQGQMSQGQMNQYQNQSTNPFSSNYQPQIANAQQYAMGANLQSNLQGGMQMSNMQQQQQPYYNQQQQQQQQQQYMPQPSHQSTTHQSSHQLPQSQLMAPNQLHTPHISPNISPHISPKHHGLRSASTGDALNLANCQQPLQPQLQPISNQRQLLAFQQQQQQQQNALQNQQPGAPVQVNLMLPPLFQQNKIAQFFYVYQSTGRSGPQLAWSIFSAIRKCDLKPGKLFVSFFFDEYLLSEFEFLFARQILLRSLRKTPFTNLLITHSFTVLAHKKFVYVHKTSLDLSLDGWSIKHLP